MEIFNPGWQQVYQTLMKSNYNSAAHLFKIANATPPLKKLDDTRQIPIPGGQDGKTSTELSIAIKHIAKTICVITGLKIIRDDASGMLKLMKRMLPAHYGNLTVTEITYAFELNSMGKLAGYAGNEKTDAGVIAHYQTFSMDYIGRVLAAYSKFRREHAPIIQQTVQKLLPQPEQKLLAADPAARELENDEFIKTAFDEFNRTGNVYLSDVVYNAMVENGIIQADAFMEFTENARQKLIGQKTLDIASKHYASVALAASIHDLKTNPNADGVDVMARKLCVIHLFKIISTQSAVQF